MRLTLGMAGPHRRRRGADALLCCTSRVSVFAPTATRKAVRLKPPRSAHCVTSITSRRQTGLTQPLLAQRNSPPCSGALCLVVAGVRELRAEEAVPHAVGHQRALADEQARGR